MEKRKLKQNNKYRNWFFGLLSITVSIFLVVMVSELVAGYFYFQKRSTEPSIILKKIKDRLNKHELRSQTYITSETEDNPFISYVPSGADPTQGYYRLHPFIGFTGFQSMWTDPNFKSYNMREAQRVRDIIKTDYFGFRNREDLYFNDKDYTLVVITGGSEAAGYSHITSIAESLESTLRSESRKNIKVLNLAMNSYTLSSEIDAYIHLAYHLKPDFVISHTGYNDLAYATMIPANFKKLGLNYLFNYELWLERLYDLNNINQHAYWVYNPTGEEFAVNGILRNMLKYDEIVSGNGGDLIIGIQGYNMDCLNDKTHKRLTYEHIIALYKELKISVHGSASDKLDFIDFTANPGIDFIDCVHTSEESRGIIAEAYANIILEHLSTEKHN